MPKVTLYIRKDDLDKWKAVKEKSEFIHAALNNEPVIKTKQQAETTIQKIAKDSQKKLCPYHYTPLTEGGKCLQKGCKLG